MTAKRTVPGSIQVTAFGDALLNGFAAHVFLAGIPIAFSPARRRARTNSGTVAQPAFIALPLVIAKEAKPTVAIQLEFWMDCFVVRDCGILAMTDRV